ncbi:hypothetical protein O181_036421 [Austropuccinia psidii MF-1]|uniref:Uncharacterized protein n=1 Tax=Austropuccinia psidii MF-1 TaxID=1389203 RepID=A0A9Q3H9W8_9BASI|nr:hypothetical protein [Austropuccinia psidii MF-1]
MKAPDCFDGTQPFKVRSFIQSCQLIFHNDSAKFSQDRKKVLYATPFLIRRAANWIEPYVSNLTIKIQITFSIRGNCLNLNSSPYLGTQMKSEKLKMNWIVEE